LLLSEKTDRIKELPESKAISILNQIHKARILGDEQAVFDITLELERTLRLKDEYINQAIREKDSKIAELTDKLKLSDDEKIIIKGDLVRMKNIWRWFWYIGRSIVAFLVFYLLYMYLFQDLVKAFRYNDRYHLVEVALRIGAPLIYIFKDYYDTKNKLD